MNDDLKQLLDYVDTVSEIDVIKLGLDYKKWRDYRLALGNLNPDEDYDVLCLIANFQRSDRPRYLYLTLRQTKSRIG